MRLCKDCAHFKGSMELEDQCIHPSNSYQEPVRGEIKTYYSPKVLRNLVVDKNTMWYCGKDAGWWVKKL